MSREDDKENVEEDAYTYHGTVKTAAEIEEVCAHQPPPLVGGTLTHAGAEEAARPDPRRLYSGL